MRGKAASAAAFVGISPSTPAIPEKWRGLAASIGEPPVFSDDVWDLSSAIAQTNISSSLRTINFANLPERYRGFVKNYLWCAMHHDMLVAEGVLPRANSLGIKTQSISPARIWREQHAVMAYLKFLEDRGSGLANVTTSDLEAWLARFKDRVWSSKHRAINVVCRSAIYTQITPFEGRVLEVAWRGVSVFDLIGTCPVIRENSTPRVPREIIDPMTRWALFLLNEGFEDILECVRAAVSPQGRIPSSLRPATLPGTSTPWLSHDVPVGILPEAIGTAAAYFLTGYLSGMRDGEVQSLRDGCSEARTHPSTGEDTYLVTATTFKTPSKLPEVKTWVVVSEVHDAIEQLKRLNSVAETTWPPPAGTRNTDLLFRVHRIHSDLNAALRERSSVMLRRLQAFTQKAALTAAQNATTIEERETILQLYYIPRLDGRPWQWITKHLRRTIAWYIANQPFGIVAGKRQFGHIREVTFEGYAGSPDAGFRDEIERARHIGQQRDIVEIYEHVKAGGDLGGPRGKSICQEGHDLTGLYGKVVGEARLLAMLKNAAKHLYPGVVNDCFFDADRALCLQRQSRRDAPIISQCDWARCPNSCVAPKHRAMLELALDDALAYRKTPKLSAVQRDALDGQIAQYRSALRAIQ